MGYSTKVGSFNINPALTATQTQAITGVGFQPKIVLFWWSGSTATGDSAGGGHIQAGIGAAVSSSSRCAISFTSGDALATSFTTKMGLSAQCIAVHISNGNLDGLMDLSSMDADGFTLVVDDQFSAAYRISYLALGGTDLTNVFIGSRTLPTSTGNFDTTDVGFQPDAVLFLSPMYTALDSQTNSAEPSIGFATGASNQGVVATFSNNAQATTSTAGYGYNGEVLARLTAAGCSIRDAFVSFLENGFRLNHLEGSSARYFFYVCLKGGQYSVGDITTKTDGTDIAETVGFQPAALLFLSANRALSTQDAVTADARLSIGAATGASERAVQAVSDENNLADTETAYANYDTAVYANVVDDAAVGLMDIKSIDASGFTAVMDDADPSGCWVAYLAIGAAAAAGGVPKHSMYYQRGRSV